MKIVDLIKRRREHSLSMRESLMLTMLLPVFALGISFLFTAIFSILFVATHLPVFSVLFFVFFILLTGLYVYISIRVFKKLYDSYYVSLFETTRRNYKSISDNVFKLEKYPETDIKEINSLNDQITTLNSEFDSAYIVARTPNYHNLALEYVDSQRHIVSFESFERELPNIIILSQSYKNILIEVYYSLKEGENSSEENKKILIDIFTELFSDYVGVLFSFREKTNSLLIYIPVVDSIKRIQEQIESVSKDVSISTRDYDGLKYAGARFSIVAYPFSDVENMISDLRYARRQNKIINFYLPKRIKNNVGRNLVLSNSMNMNYMSYLLDQVNNLSYDYTSKESDIKLISSLFMDVANYLDIDDVGIISRNIFTNTYILEVSKGGRSDLFINGNIDQALVEAFEVSAESDNSYFFSRRSSASNHLGRELDLYNISSGFYYIIKDELGQIDSVIYFFNKGHKNMVLDTYLRESLFVLCLKMQHYFELLRQKQQIDIYRSESEYLMSLTRYSLYKVDEKTHELKYFSKDLKTMFPHLELGIPCHKALFDSDKPCYNCPLRNSKKKQFTYKNTDFEISLTLNDRINNTKSLLVEKLNEGEISGDLFNKDLLINSYLSLYQNIKNSYYSNGRGYVILISIDNVDDILAKQGSESTLYLIRSFLRKVKIELKSEELYFYNNRTFALLLHNVGHVDAINTCERIYQLSKEHIYKNVDDDIFNITYLSLRWPSGYANAEDFMKHIADYYNSNAYERNKDFIYFYDHKIARSASRRAFIISVIEQEFSGSFSSVNLQPIVKAKDKRIFGAEILLRINNVYSNVVFNAEEISHIAEQEGKTNIITEAIINFIGNMYKEYGNSVFKINSFERIGINIDGTYLKDLSLVKGIVDLNNVYNFPNNFLAFEIPEELIPNHINEIAKMSQELEGAHIVFSVDRYTGKHIGIEKLKELGFKEVKIARDLVYKVDTDSTRYSAIQDIVNNAKEVGIDVTVVGVENSAQFTMLKDLDIDMKMQGYHFYKPLSRSDFISALISHNR